MSILKMISFASLSIALAVLPRGSAAAQQTITKAAAEAKQTLQTLPETDRSELSGFEKRVKAYVDQEHSLPASRLSPKSDVAQLERSRLALRDALQQARPNAKQGDIFTAESAGVFRKLLAAAMKGRDGAKIRASLNHAEPIGPRDLKVNQVYPNVAGQPLQSVPPTLLFYLPSLPKGVEYRIVDHTLLLRDTDANMVVDFLPDALP